MLNDGGDVVLQIASDARKIMHHIDSMALQLGTGTNA
jgi:hypothetical protein